jgi:hypothetical protein
MRTTVLLFFILSIYSLSAQNADTETIDGNSVSGVVTDEGYFFNDFQNSTNGYKVPAGTGAGTIYAAGIWAGGLDVNGQLHLTAPNSTLPGWRSGPIADNSSYGTISYQTTYSTSIWKVTKQQVDDHIAQYQQGGYTPVAAISDWPGNGDVSMGVADQLAPFVDLDADGVYEPLDGDYPNFPGDQVVYVIQNDESYLPQPQNLGVELHLMFYQFNDNGYLNETTFLNVRVFNRSTTNYYDFKLSIFADFDIGNPTDDYFGSSVTNNMMYAYNGDNYDEPVGGTIGYEDNPPCQGIMSLNHTLFAANNFHSSAAFPMAPPTTNLEYWHFMNGLWADGSPIFYGGNGYNAGVTTTPTKFIYPGESDPLGLATWGSIIHGDWGEYNANGGSPNFPSDRRGLMSISSGDFLVATTICADFVFLFNDTDVDTHDNVQNVLNIADAVQILYDSNSDFPCGYFTASTLELEPLEFNVFPNPSSGAFTLQLINGFEPVIVQVRDLTGRLLYSKMTQTETTHLQLDVPAGVYQLVVQSAHNSVVKSIVVQ